MTRARTEKAKPTGVSLYPEILTLVDNLQEKEEYKDFSLSHIIRLAVTEFAKSKGVFLRSVPENSVSVQEISGN